MLESFDEAISFRRVVLEEDTSTEAEVLVFQDSKSISGEAELNSECTSETDTL